MTCRGDLSLNLERQQTLVQSERSLTASTGTTHLKTPRLFQQCSLPFSHSILPPTSPPPPAGFSSSPACAF